MISQNFFGDDWRAALQYWRDPDQKSWILVAPCSVGDTWLTCALSRAFKATHGGTLTLVVKEGQYALYEMYEHNFDRVIVWEDDRLLRFSNRIRGCGFFEIDQPIIAHPGYLGFASQIFPLLELMLLEGRGGVSVADQWRLSLKLDWESALERPFIRQSWRDEALALADRAGVVPGKSVILFPDNNSNPPLPDGVWEAIAKGLVSRGLTVFTNLHGNVRGRRLEPIVGTLPITISIRNAIPLVEHAGRFISMSNGLQALMMGSGIQAEHTFLIHDTSATPTWGATGLKVNNPMIQGFRVVGVATGKFNEYVVNPNELDVEMIDAIARNDPAYTAII